MLPESLHIDFRAVAAALFLPLLFWTGSVITVTMLGYPEVVWMTPAAWLLALPVGMRLRRESSSGRPRQRIEAAGAGGLLGLAQAGIVLIVLLWYALPQPGLFALALPVVLLLSPVVTAALASVTARLAK